MSPKIRYTRQSCALALLAYGCLTTTAHAGFDWTPPKPKPVAQDEITLDDSGNVQNGPLTPELDTPVAAPVTDVDSSELPVVPDEGKRVAGMQTIPAKAADPAPVSAPAPDMQEPVMADDVNNAPATLVTPAPVATSSPSSTPVYEGFGQDITLVLALREIVPTSYAFAFDRPEYAAQTISWDGGRPWLDVLNSALAKRSLVARVTGSTVRIQSLYGAAPTPEPAPAPAAAYEPAPVSEPVAQSDSKPMDITNSTSSDYPDTVASAPTQQEISVKASVADMTTRMTWKAAPGSTLREVLEGWSKVAKVDLQWMTPYDYPINNTFMYEGTFQEALSSILSSYSRENPKPRGKLYPNAPTGPSVLMIN